MTEIDRLLQEGVIPDNFLLPETRCDFIVDEKRKKTWAIAIDLLLKFDNVCKKYNLRYCLAYGTLLGAIRHKGFIPWDDDVDVCMPRDDYEKLQELKDEFNNPYFLQTPFTDSGYYYSYIKVRNSNTTAFSKNLRYHMSANDCNSGMSLDVFCVDKWEKNEDAEKLYNRIKALIIKNSTAMKLNNPDFSKDERVINYDGSDPIETYLSIQQLSKEYHDVETQFLSMPIITAYGYARDIFDKKDFAETTLHPFEFLNLPVPIGYDNILSCIYGDYMKYPPLESRGKWHTAITDPEVPYSNYYARFRKGENLWPTR